MACGYAKSSWQNSFGTSTGRKFHTYKLGQPSFEEKIILWKIKKNPCLCHHCHQCLQHHHHWNDFPSGLTLIARQKNGTQFLATTLFVRNMQRQRLHSRPRLREQPCHRRPPRCQTRLQPGWWKVPTKMVAKWSWANQEGCQHATPREKIFESWK